jgi:hypothetical protein
MKTPLISSNERSAAPIRRIFSPAILAIAFASTLPLFAGCRCPETNHPEPLKDDPKQAEAIKTKLDEAQAKKTWTTEDEQAFRTSLGHLSPETRFASRVRLATLINSQAVKIVRSPSKSPPPPPPTCTCTPGTCDRVATPVPAAPPPATNVPPTAAPPGTKAK